MEQVNVTLTETIKVLLDDKKFSTLRDILVTMKPYDIAAIFENLQDEKMPILFRILPKELAAETFVEMDDETQEFLIHGFSDSELKEVVDELFVDDAVDLIEEMPANVVKRILRQADKDMRKQINELLKYPEDSAGSIMTTEFIVLRPDMTAEMAIKRIRRTGVDKETIYTCYVTDANNKLIGITTVKDLLLAEDDELVVRQRLLAFRARNRTRALVHRVKAAAKVAHRAAAIDLVANFETFAVQRLGDLLHGFFRVSRAGIVKA